jgi:hypothetical protein
MMALTTDRTTNAEPTASGIPALAAMELLNCKFLNDVILSNESDTFLVLSNVMRAT